MPIFNEYTQIGCAFLMQYIRYYESQSLLLKPYRIIILGLAKNYFLQLLLLVLYF